VVFATEAWQAQRGEIDYSDNDSVYIFRITHDPQLGPVNTNPIGSVAPEKMPIKTRGEKFGLISNKRSK
jgi:hypothetical protein